MYGTISLCCVSDEETGDNFRAKYLLGTNPDTWKGDGMINAEPGGLSSIRFAEKGTLRLGFVVRCRGANGAYMHLSEGAIRVASTFVGEAIKVEEVDVEVGEELKDYLGREDARSAVDGIMGKGAADRMLKVTANVGVLKGGVKVNVIQYLSSVSLNSIFGFRWALSQIRSWAL